MLQASINPLVWQKMLNNLGRDDGYIVGKKSIVLQRDNANSMDGESQQRIGLKTLKNQESEKHSCS